MKHDEFMFKHGSTVRYIKDLKAANFTDEQIEVLAKRDEDHDNQLEQLSEFTTQQKVGKKDLVTNQSLEIVKLELQKEIEVLCGEVKTDIKTLEIKLMTIYGGGFLILTGILAKGFHWV